MRQVSAQVDFHRVTEQRGSVSRSDPFTVQPEGQRVPDRVQGDRRHPSIAADGPEAVRVPLRPHATTERIHDHEAALSPRRTCRQFVSCLARGEGAEAGDGARPHGLHRQRTPPRDALGVVHGVSVAEGYPALGDADDAGLRVDVSPAQAEDVGSGEAARGEPPCSREVVGVGVLDERAQLFRLPVFEVSSGHLAGAGSARQPCRVPRDGAFAHRQIERLRKRDERGSDRAGTERLGLVRHLRAAST